MDQKISNVALEFRDRIVKVINEDFLEDGHASTERLVLPDKYKSILDSINGFIVISNYKTGLYEYISEGVKSNLGYDLRNQASDQLTDFMFSIIDAPHRQFILDKLLPIIFKYFKENSNYAQGTDYRYTCCVKLKNIYNVYEWYLLDTVLIKVDQTGFPVRTLITCTNINQFKKDESIYYNILKKNNDGVYEIVLEGTADNNKENFNLTPREIQIINLIAHGYTNKEIGEKLFISINTVQTHRKSIIKKTNCVGVAELTNFAYSRGML